MNLEQLKEHLDHRFDEHDKRLVEAREELKELREDVETLQESWNFSRGAVKAGSVTFMGIMAILGLIAKFMPHS